MPRHCAAKLRGVFGREHCGARVFVGRQFSSQCVGLAKRHDGQKGVCLLYFFGIFWTRNSGCFVRDCETRNGPLAVFDLSQKSALFSSHAGLRPGYLSSANRRLSLFSKDTNSTILSTRRHAYLVQTLKDKEELSVCDNIVGVCLDTLGPVSSLSVVPYEVQKFLREVSLSDPIVGAKATDPSTKLHSRFLYNLLNLRGNELLVQHQLNVSSETTDHRVAFRVLANVFSGQAAAKKFGAASASQPLLLRLGTRTLVEHATILAYDAQNSWFSIFWNADVVSSLSVWQGIGIFFLFMFVWRRSDAYSEEKPDESDEISPHKVAKLGLSKQQAQGYAYSLVSDVGSDTVLALHHAVPNSSFFSPWALVRPVFVASRIQLSLDPWIFAFVIAAFITSAVSGTLVGPSVSGYFLQNDPNVSSTSVQPVEIVFYILLACFACVQLVTVPVAIGRAWRFETQTFWDKERHRPPGVLFTWFIWVNLSSSLRLFFGWLLPAPEILERFGVPKTLRAREHFLLSCAMRLSATCSPPLASSCFWTGTSPIVYMPLPSQSRSFYC